MTDRNQVARQDLKKRAGKRIIIYGAPIQFSTGNGKLIKRIAQAFQSAGHTVYTIGLEYNGPQITIDNIPIMPTGFCKTCGPGRKGNDEYVNTVAGYINLLQPDFFIAVGDPIQVQEHGIGRLNFTDMQNTFSIMYATLDAEGMWCTTALSQKMPDYLDYCDRSIGTAKFTQEQFKTWRNEDVDYIYEIVDTSIYKPVTKEKRTELRKNYRFKEDDFIIYSGGRCILRKDHNCLIDAAVKFLCETKDTYLFLNIPPSSWRNDGTPVFSDTYNPWHFVDVVMTKKYGRNMLKEGRVTFVRRGELGSTAITEAMNAEFYQISDVFAYTTVGEGFGLMPVESMACGVPAIVPDNTTGREILGEYQEDGEYDNLGDALACFGYAECEGGLLLECTYDSHAVYSLIHHMTDVNCTYQAIKKFYEDKELRARLVGRCRDHVLNTFIEEEFRQKWLDVLKTTTKRKKVADEFKKLSLGGKEDGEGKKQDGNTPSQGE